MSEVIKLPSQKKKIWVCLCGCSTFQIFDDGSTVCAACDKWSPDDGGGWVDELSDKGAFEGERFNDIQGNGSVAFARARAVKIASQPDARIVLSVDVDGGICCWSDISDEVQRDWALRRLDAAKSLIEDYDLG